MLSGTLPSSVITWKKANTTTCVQRITKGKFWNYGFILLREQDSNFSVLVLFTKKLFKKLNAIPTVIETDKELES